MKHFYVAMAVALAFAPSAALAKEELSKSQVMSSVIGKRCTMLNRSDWFKFTSGGKYQFHRTSVSTPVYTWSWASNGRIKGETVTYVFYKNPDGTYSYWNGKAANKIKCG